MLAFLAALLVYAITRFWRIGEYPIYFFTDEAIQPVHAEELIRRGWRGVDGIRFPMYFQNANAWGPFLPVYLHAAALSLFGKSVEVTRGTIALLTVSAAGAVALTLRVGFRSRLWWVAPLVLAATPVWFLHSRTAFETVAATSFYAWFMLFYVLYRCRSPWFLYPAIMSAGCAFYSYSNAQAVVATAGLLLAVIDARYHLRHPHHLLGGLLLAVVVGLPLLAFRRTHPEAVELQLTRVSSYWYQPLSLPEKLGRFVGEYGHGLSPEYWFSPAAVELNRHRMLGYGHLPIWTLPLVLSGVGLSIWRLRSPAHRVLLVMAVASPVGGALAAIGVTRVMAFVIPAAALAVVGAEPMGGLLVNRRVRVLSGAALLLIMAGLSQHLLYDALTYGPRWFRDYTMSGQQWGAKQLFDVIPGYLHADPSNRVLLTSTWANGTDVFPRFFMDQGRPEAARVAMGNVRDFLSVERPLGRSVIFIMTGEELNIARSSGRFSTVEVERTLSYPDGSPGFHFVRLAYAPNFAALVEADKAARRALVDDQVTIGVESVAVRHSKMDAGSLRDIFDGEKRTLGRFNAANPAVLELRLPSPRRVGQVQLTLSAGNWEVAVHASSGEDPPRSYAVVARSPVTDPDVIVALAVDQPPVDLIRVEMRLVDAGEEAIVHLRELQLRP
jgi:hypothetical protein